MADDVLASAECRCCGEKQGHNSHAGRMKRECSAAAARNQLKSTPA
jgi:hypothetical protein